MAGLIPQHFIDDLLTRIDIVEVIDSRVPLKKKGQNHMACCPFHSEKTPSFSVNQEKQFYHCFGCGVSGSAISFLMEYENLNFVEAIEALAESAGVEVPREDDGQPATKRVDYSPLYDALETASKFFQQQLRQHPAAQGYFKQRGLSGETARDFLLGYAPEGWNNLEKHFGPKYDEQLLLRAGLLSKNDKGKIYDKFRERIMFPILDRRGRVIAFGGRITGEGEPKYLNSPESPVFHKGDTLYGLYEAKKSNTRLDSLLVVEGYMDCIALAQHGIKNVVATLGTATTREHLQQLFRTVKRVIICFDGDEAGRKAAWRALEQALPILRDDLEIDFLFLPDGEDPDSLLQKQGAAGFREILENAQALSAYLLDSLRKRHELGTLEGRSRMTLEARKLLQTLKPGLLREQLTQHIAELAALEPKHLLTETVNKRPPRVPSRLQTRSQTLKMTAMRQAIACLIQKPALAENTSEEQLSGMQTLPGGELFCLLADIINEQPEATTAILLEHVRDSPHIRTVQRLSVWQPPEAESWPELLTDALQQLSRQQRENRLQELLDRSRSNSLNTEEKQELGRLLQS